MSADERPDDDTIEDDAELDAYLQDLERKHAEMRLRARSHSG